VTFDDGYSDNYHSAKPIMEKYQVPATFFIVSGMVGQREEFWWDHLERLIVHSVKLPTIELTMDEVTHRWEPIADRAGLYEKIWRTLSELSPQARLSAVKQIESQIHEPLPSRTTYFPVTREEVADLSRLPLFEIGSHTANHPFL